MTPISFLWYSLIGLGDVFGLIFLFGVFQPMVVNMYRKMVRIGYEERRKFLDELARANLTSEYRSMN